nr:hypothetical protein [uncultured Desulfobacter sp.]
MIAKWMYNTMEDEEKTKSQLIRELQEMRKHIFDPFFTTKPMGVST